MQDSLDKLLTKGVWVVEKGQKALCVVIVSMSLCLTSTWPNEVLESKQTDLPCDQFFDLQPLPYIFCAHSILERACLLHTQALRRYGCHGCKYTCRFWASGARHPSWNQNGWSMYLMISNFLTKPLFGYRLSIICRGRIQMVHNTLMYHFSKTSKNK